MDLETDPSLIQIDVFLALTLGIVVYFTGARLSERFAILGRYAIPEPVSGGLLASLCVLGVVLLTGRTVVFDLAARDVLLIYFFTTIGLNARVADLRAGGPLLAILLVITIGYMIVQLLVGTLGATLFGLPPQAGVMLGTAALVGGHGTAIAWGPVIASEHAVAGAAELGIATATVGLIMASLLGGPIGRYLIEGRDLRPAPDEAAAPAASEERITKAQREEISHVGLMRSILWIHIAVILGAAAHEALKAAGLMLPLFVPCLLAGILLANTLPALFPRMPFPAQTPALALVSEFSLSVFLSMSLMSMELWTLAGSAGVLAFTMILQVVVAAAFILFVVFRFMGRDYTAAVLSAGFAGFALGATPTAIANMTAVTQRYGPAPLAFIVLPLISAFFVDLANALLIQTFLSL
ncbi:MAG: sodium/glutamate symporter [Pseudomonadota bacterium]